MHDQEVDAQLEVALIISVCLSICLNGRRPLKKGMASATGNSKKEKFWYEASIV